MTDALSAMEYPHWLMVAGAVLLMLGLIGLAYHRRKGDDAEAPEAAHGGRANLEALARIPGAKPPKQTRDGWAGKEVTDKAKPSDNPPPPSKEPV
jgi:hypothetical protein